MILPRDGVEYATWTVTTDHPIGGVDIEIAGTWHPAAVTGSQVRLLVAGPDVPNPPANAVVITDHVQPRIRVTDHPEVVVRTSGWIQLDPRG